MSERHDARRQEREITSVILSLCRRVGSQTPLIEGSEKMLNREVRQRANRGSRLGQSFDLRVEPRRGYCELRPPFDILLTYLFKHKFS